MSDQSNTESALVAGVKIIRDLGRDAAMGKDSLPKLAFQVTKMAAKGTIDTNKKYNETLPDGGTRAYDDAEYLFTEYAKAEGKKAIHERSNGGLKANISKVRQFITFGALTTCDPQSVLEAGVAKRREMIDAGVKVKSAYAAYVDIARAQIGKDADMTPDELENVIRKPEAASPELEKILRGVFKKLEGLVTGEGAGNIQDQSVHVENAFQSIRDRLAEIDAANNTDAAEQTLALLPADKMAALLASMGYQKVEAQ
jgi:hypothetical protein